MRMILVWSIKQQKRPQATNPLGQAAKSKSGLMISVKKSYGQHVLKTNGIGRATEEDIEAMNFKFICETVAEASHTT